MVTRFCSRFLNRICLVQLTGLNCAFKVYIQNQHLHSSWHFSAHPHFIRSSQFYCLTSASSLPQSATISVYLINMQPHLPLYTLPSQSQNNILWQQPRPRPSIFIYIFLIFSAFSHEKTGTRWFGGGAEEGQIEGPVDFPTTRPKLPWNCLGREMSNYCVLKQNYLQFNSEFKPIQVQVQ
jgi:hypothetical protein